MLTRIDSGQIAGLPHFYYLDKSAIQSYIDSLDSDAPLVAISDSAGALAEFSKWYDGAREILFVPTGQIRSGASSAMYTVRTGANWLGELPNWDDRDVVFLAAGGETMESPPVGTILYDYLLAETLPDQMLADSIQSLRAQDKAVLLVPDEVGSDGYRDVVDRYIKLSGYQDVEVIPWVSHFGARSFPYNDFFFDNHYHAWDVDSVFDSNPDVKLVCFTDHCGKYVPSALTVDVDLDKIYRVEHGLSLIHI